MLVLKSVSAVGCLFVHYLCNYHCCYVLVILYDIIATTAHSLYYLYRSGGVCLFCDVLHFDLFITAVELRGQTQVTNLSQGSACLPACMETVDGSDTMSRYGLIMKTHNGDVKRR